MEAVVTHTAYPLVHIIYLQMFLAMDHCSGSRPLTFATVLILGPHWYSSWIFCFDPVSWICYKSVSAGLAPINDLALHIWGE